MTSIEVIEGMEGLRLRTLEARPPAAALKLTLSVHMTGMEAIEDMEGLASINDARLPGESEIEFAAMLRGIGAVVVGYLVMAVAVFVIFSAMFAVIGQERAFEPGSYAVTWFWLVPAFIVSIIAAMLGGFVCTRLSPGRAPQILAALVLVLGVALALPVLSPGNDPRPTTRPAGISDIEAMGNARQPPMVALLNPLIGCVGVLLGARRTKI